MATPVTQKQAMMRRAVTMLDVQRRQHVEAVAQEMQASAEMTHTIETKLRVWVMMAAAYAHGKQVHVQAIVAGTKKDANGLRTPTIAYGTHAASHRHTLRQLIFSAYHDITTKLRTRTTT